MLCAHYFLLIFNYCLNENQNKIVSEAPPFVVTKNTVKRLLFILTLIGGTLSHTRQRFPLYHVHVLLQLLTSNSSRF